MKEQVYKGNISFINHEKKFATIEYLHNNKLKSVNFKLEEAAGKKSHQFMLGDGVNFHLKLSDRGDKQSAYHVQFTYNSAIDLLIQKSAIENRFSGYLKIAGDKYFVKEWDNYILFPLQLSPWEKPPVESAANEAISFRLLNLDKPRSIVAELFSHNFIPEYKMALQHFNHRIDIPAVVYKITPHAVYLDLFGDKIRSKLSLSDFEKEDVKVGDTVPVIITHLTHTRIVVKRAGSIDQSFQP